MRCVGGQQPETHEVWTFSNDGISPKNYSFAHVDVGAFSGDFFPTDYLTENERRVPMFGKKLIHGSFEWICVPDFLRANVIPLNVNILAPYAYCAREGPSTNQNLSSDSGGYFASVHINWNRLTHKLLIYHRRVFEKMRSAGRHACDNLLRENRKYCIQSPSTYQNPIHGCLENRRDGTLDDRWDFTIFQ